MAKIPGLTPEQQAAFDEAKKRERDGSILAGVVNRWRGNPADAKITAEMIEGLNIYATKYGSPLIFKTVKAEAR